MVISQSRLPCRSVHNSRSPHNEFERLTEFFFYQVELGMIGAGTLMGIAFQLRFYRIFIRRLKELRNADRAEEQGIEHAAKKMAKVLEKDLEKFEKRHSQASLSKSELAGGGLFPGTTPDSPDSPTNNAQDEKKREGSRSRWSRTFYSKGDVAASVKSEEHEEQKPVVLPSQIDLSLPRYVELHISFD
jgi:hypothetical protein